MVETHSKLERTPNSEADMEEKFDIDMDFREQNKMEVSSYEQAQKKEDGTSEIIELFRTFVRYERKYPEESERTIETLKDIAANQSITQPPLKQYDVTVNSYSNIGGIMLYDLHINKRDIDHTPLEDKLMKYDAAIDYHAGMMQQQDVEKIVLVIGGDFFNSDGNNKTSNDTHIENIHGERDAFSMGSDWIVKKIEELRQHFHVEVISVLGNHDKNALSNLGVLLQFYYEDEETVTVRDPYFRVYKRHGKTLLGFGHGKNETFKNFAQIMTKEFMSKQDKAYTHAYGIMGHIHNRAMKPFGMLNMERVPSGSKEGERGEKKGYNMGNPAIHSYIWSKDKGELCRFIFGT